MAPESDAPAGVVTVIGLGGIPELDETDDWYSDGRETGCSASPLSTGLSLLGALASLLLSL